MYIKESLHLSLLPQGFNLQTFSGCGDQNEDSDSATYCQTGSSRTKVKVRETNIGKTGRDRTIALLTNSIFLVSVF